MDKKTWTFGRGSQICSVAFDQKWEMRGGRFPKPHPCHDDPKPMVMGRSRVRKPGTDEMVDCPGEQPVSDTALGLFRSRGYWASCYPEGDGIVFEPLDSQKDDRIIADIEECFGVIVQQR